MPLPQVQVSEEVLRVLPGQRAVQRGLQVEPWRPLSTLLPMTLLPITVGERARCFPPDWGRRSRENAWAYVLTCKRHRFLRVALLLRALALTPRRGRCRRCDECHNTGPGGPKDGEQPRAATHVAQLLRTQQQQQQQALPRLCWTSLLFRAFKQSVSVTFTSRDIQVICRGLSTTLGRSHICSHCLRTRFLSGRGEPRPVGKAAIFVSLFYLSPWGTWPAGKPRS